MEESKQKTICVLPGDGIGPEVIAPAVRVLRNLAAFGNYNLEIKEDLIGGAALDHYGTPLSDETLRNCRSSDAILLGAVGGPKWDDYPASERPEAGLLAIRKGLGLYGNIRPVRQVPALVQRSTLKPEVICDVDLVVVRELTGGLYFGQPRGISGSPRAESGHNTMVYHRHEVERIARKAFDLARMRRKKVTSVDKANVLEVSQFWRNVVLEIHEEFADVELDHQYVDNCAMQMVLRPSQFDVILTENTFGDILSDIGGVLTGSIGTLPSASVGDGPSLFEPVHGSAPDIAGQNLANPIGAISCVGMMFELSFDRPDLSQLVSRSVNRVLSQGLRTRDLSDSGKKTVGTIEFVDSLSHELHSAAKSVQFP